MSNALLPSHRPTAPKVANKELTELQKQVVDLAFVAEQLNPREIAERLNCNRENVYRILSKQHVREYIMQRIGNKLLLSGIKALATQDSLLTSKSDYVKHQAATDLMNRNSIGSSGDNQGVSVQVNIDLS